MLAEDTEMGKWYVAPGGTAVVDDEGFMVAYGASERSALQIVREHNAIADALADLRSDHVDVNLFRLGALGAADIKRAIKRLAKGGA